MPKYYSEDLREKVIKYVEKEKDKHKASEVFGIGIATVYKWIRERKTRGHSRPMKRKYAYKKVDDDALIKYVQEHPDHFLSEIGEYFSVTPQTIFYALKRLKITRKKKLLSIRRETLRKEKSF